MNKQNQMAAFHLLAKSGLKITLDIFFSGSSYGQHLSTRLIQSVLNSLDLTLNKHHLVENIFSMLVLK